MGITLLLSTFVGKQAISLLALGLLVKSLGLDHVMGNIFPALASYETKMNKEQEK